ncbi:MAG TPA: discoidin domain-containing protein [Polyangiaceae bacterium]|jgi:hypothetical protein
MGFYTLLRGRQAKYIGLISLGLTACLAAPGESGEGEKAGEETASTAALELTSPGVSITTRSYDNQRSAANTAETVLTAANVNTSQFGKLFELPVDDQVYAQILYVSPVTIGGVVHRVVYAATLNNTVYAFDADVAGAPLWSRNFNGTGRPTTRADVGQSCGTYNDFSGNIGIVSTPVIDAAAKTMYLVARTVEASGTVQRLYAIDITSGVDRAASPQVIQASVKGTGEGSVNGVVTFDPVTQNQRSSLALANGVVYLAWASFCDTGPFHGWVMAYDASSLAQVGVFNTSPNASGAGIWQAGAAPAFDASGNLYYATGNGFGSNAFDGTSDFSETVVKLAPRTLAMLDSFTPSNYATLDSSDSDLGSAGPSFLPGGRLLVMGGKEGKSYLLDSTNMGKMVSGDTQILQGFQSVDPTAMPNATHHIHNTVAQWASPAGLNMYVSGENDYLRAYRFNATTQRFQTPSVVVSSVLPPQGMPGGMVSISANGSQSGTGIVWVTTPRIGNANQSVVPGMFRAYNAETLALLWDSSRPADDTLNFGKFSPPTVANGKVYVSSFSNLLSVYGLRPPPPPNLALGKTATGSASCASTEGAANAFNGSITGGLGDKWCSLQSNPYLQVDLGTIYDVSSFVVRHAGAGEEDLGFNTRDFDILVSTDGTNFTNAVHVTGNTLTSSTHKITPTPARYVKLSVVTPAQNGNTAARIYEFEVYGSGAASQTDLALGAAATGSTPCASTEGPEKAVDGKIAGSLGYKWCTLQSTKTLQIDLGAVMSVNKIVLQHAGAGGESTAYDTRAYTLQVSTDGSLFTQVAKVTANTADTTTHTFATTAARYVKLNVTTPTQNGNAAARIYEVQVYGP